MTALEMIEAALRLIKVKEQSQALNADEAAEGLEGLNIMLHSWEFDGIYLSHTDLALADAIPYDDTHLRAIKYNLAMELVSDYEDADVPAAVPGIARSTHSALVRQYDEIDNLQIDPGLQSRGQWDIING